MRLGYTLRMRGERLLAIMLRLEGRGRASARSLARESEVSLRTIFRDIDSLCASGVPIVAETGPGGGYSLMPGWRSGLSGLNEREAEALFASISGNPLADLGLESSLRSALLKVAAALPECYRLRQEQASKRILIEGGAQGAGGGVLATLHEALMATRCVRVSLSLPWAPVAGARTRLVLKPLGLVASGGAWQLCALSPGGARCYELARIESADLLDERYDIPDDFNLSEFWAGERERAALAVSAYSVRARLSPEAAAALGPAVKGERDGVFELRFGSLEAARATLLPWGGAVEALAPEALRLSMADLARSALAVYTKA